MFEFVFLQLGKGNKYSTASCAVFVSWTIIHAFIHCIVFHAMAIHFVRIGVFWLVAQRSCRQALKNRGWNKYSDIWTMVCPDWCDSGPPSAQQRKSFLTPYIR